MPVGSVFWGEKRREPADEVRKGTPKTCLEGTRTLEGEGGKRSGPEEKGKSGGVDRVLGGRGQKKNRHPVAEASGSVKISSAPKRHKGSAKEEVTLNCSKKSVQSISQEEMTYGPTFLRELNREDVS